MKRAHLAEDHQGGKEASAIQVRVAVLVSGAHVEQWQRDALDTLVRNSDVEITHVVVNSQAREDDATWLTFLREALAQLREYPLWSLVGVGRQLTPDSECVRRVHIESIESLSDAETLHCSPQPAGGYWNRLPDQTIDSIEDVDVVIRFGFGMLKGRILDAPSHGVLSYHPGDIRTYRGQPGGFWEFLSDDDEVGVTVQRINETLDGGEIVALETIDISDAHTWQEVTRRIYETADGMLAPAVRTLIDPEQAVRQPDQIGELRSHPRGRNVLRYLLKNTYGRMRKFRSEWHP